MFVALFALEVVFAFGLTFAAMSITGLKTSQHDTLRNAALNAAEAGIQRAISQLREISPDGTTDGSWRCEYEDAEANEDLGNSQSYSFRIRDGAGINAGKIVVTSIGTAANGSITVRRTVEVVIVLEQENVSVWNNVIFGGVGQAGKSINGNVIMRGSIHLLGDGEAYTDEDGDGHWDRREPFSDNNGNGTRDPGEPFVDLDSDGRWSAGEPYDDVNGNNTCDPPLTVTDIAEEIAGTADVGNNYSGMSNGLKSLIPTIPTKVFNGEVVESLSAKLRVKHGRVNISGSASVGFSDVAGGSPAMKETLDGAYVSDGWGGNMGAASVYSDNGKAADYDLGDGVVKFPALTDPFTDGLGVSYPSYQNYLENHATVVNGAQTLVKGTPFSVSGPNGSITLDASGNMTIEGIVYVTGDLSIASKDNPIRYSGKGTLVSTGTVHVHGDLLPATQFPTDAIGIIARHRLELATGPGDAQLSMAGAFYAQERVVSSKQSEIAGTLVGSYYQLTNVPHIYQVPALTDNLPPGMPGSDPIWVTTVSVKSWREF